MITGELKNKIDGLWDIFAAGGLVNPLEVIEQITYLMFIHDLDDSDNRRAKESAMLGLPYQSIFAEEVKIGIGLLMAYNLNGLCFMISRQTKCILLCRSGYSHLSRRCIVIKTVHIPNIWMMPFSNYLHRLYCQRLWIHWMKFTN